MLKTLSIKSLYALALAEGEGVGTAYEYYAKRLVLSPWLRQIGWPIRLLIAGLPEKYGSSLDFLQLAEELNIAVTIADDREPFLNKFKTSFTTAQTTGWLTKVIPKTMHVTDMARLPEVNGRFDLCVCSEVLQRLPKDDRVDYVSRLARLGTAVAIFAPNADNPDHTHLSGLSSLHLDELESLVTAVAPISQINYIDMPPFPSGTQRSEEQREQASSGKLEAAAMWSLAYYARLEKFLPLRIRRHQAHIVYGLLEIKRLKD